MAFVHLNNAQGYKVVGNGIFQKLLLECSGGEDIYVDRSLVELRCFAEIESMGRKTSVPLERYSYSLIP